MTAPNTLILSFAGGFSEWEIVLLLLVVVILFTLRDLLKFIGGMRQGMKDFRKATREVIHEMHSVSAESGRTDASQPGNPSGEFLLWLAQGFDVGRIPWAPGTFGSLVGLLWFAVLLVPGSLVIYLIGIAVSIAVSVVVCTEAERILGETNPGSVVIDEIIALPICFLPWVFREYIRMGGAMPSAEVFFTGNAVLGSAGIFLLFRVFDIAKPWPVRQSQRLPAGLGVTIDDCLAAGYVAIVSLFFLS